MWPRAFPKAWRTPSILGAGGLGCGLVTVPAPTTEHRWRFAAKESHCGSDRGGAVFPKYDAEGFTHDAAAGFSLFLQERCQRIFFIRHAEGLHNVAERMSIMEPKNAILLKENSGYVYWDPKLTPRGEEQCANLKASIRGTAVWGFDKPLNLDLVVTSPTMRTLQTACLSLGSPDSPGAPKFITHEGCREKNGGYMCDSRRSIQELRREFPGVDFALIQHDHDYMFETVESDEDVQKRANAFLQWLCGRPEQHIAVVTHSFFLRNLLRQFGEQIAEEDREYLHGNWVNAEMRSIMLCAHRKFPSSLLPGEMQDSKSNRQSTSVWNGQMKKPVV